jgi:hypothetical protein
MLINNAALSQYLGTNDPVYGFSASDSALDPLKGVRITKASNKDVYDKITNGGLYVKSGRYDADKDGALDGSDLMRYAQSQGIHKLTSAQLADPKLGYASDPTIKLLTKTLGDAYGGWDNLIDPNKSLTPKESADIARYKANQQLNLFRTTHGKPSVDIGPPPEAMTRVNPAAGNSSAVWGLLDKGYRPSDYTGAVSDLNAGTISVDGKELQTGFLGAGMMVPNVPIRGKDNSLLGYYVPKSQIELADDDGSFYYGGERVRKPFEGTKGTQISNKTTVTKDRTAGGALNSEWMSKNAADIGDGYFVPNDKWSADPSMFRITQTHETKMQPWHFEPDPEEVGGGLWGALTRGLVTGLVGGIGGAGLGAALGGGFGGAVAGKALAGAATSAIGGGNVGQGALLGGLGGALGEYASGLNGGSNAYGQSMADGSSWGTAKAGMGALNPSTITNSVGKAGINMISGMKPAEALANAGASLAGMGISDQVKGTLSGTGLDPKLAGYLGQAAGGVGANVIKGQDLGDALTNAAIGTVGGIGGGMLSNAVGGGVLGNIAGGVTSGVIKDQLGQATQGQPSQPVRPQPQTAAQRFAAMTPQQQAALRAQYAPQQQTAAQKFAAMSPQEQAALKAQYAPQPAAPQANNMDAMKQAYAAMTPQQQQALRSQYAGG